MAFARKITAPGIYPLFPSADYHADPCPHPSLSSSIALKLFERSPHHAWTAHPRLNKECPIAEATRGMDVGSGAHALWLGHAEDLVIIQADNYQKKAAQQLRDEAREDGKTPLLVADYQLAARLAAAAAQFTAELLPGGTANEVVIAWQEDGFWFRAKIDRLWFGWLTFLDYKTTKLSAEPFAATLRLYKAHYHFQMAFYERGLNALDLANMGRRKPLVLFQEIDPPYGMSLIQIDEGGMTVGRKMVHAAIEIWKSLMLSSAPWPGYRKEIFHGQIPPFVEKQWMDREMRDPLLTGETGVMPPYEPKELVFE